MTIFLIAPECVAETDTRILEVEHSALVENKGESYDNGTKKIKYIVSSRADPHAVNYIFWGSHKMKAIFEKKKQSGEFNFPVKGNCRLCPPQT